MAEATLYYFDGRGKGEGIRFMLAAAEVKYTGVLLTKREEMLQLISDGLLTFDQLPLLKIDGISLVQSGAIVRYLARRKSGLYGKDNKEAGKIDEYYEGSRDFNNNFGPLKFKDVNEVLDHVRKTALPRYLPAFEKILKANGTGYLVGSSLTLADVGLFEAIANTIEFIGQDALDDYPNVQKFYKTVSELPNISGFLSSPFRKRANDDRYVADVKRVLNW